MSTDPADPRAFIYMANLLRQQISNGTLKPGERTPSITEMAKQFKHARPTCAKALHLLETEGLVFRVPGYGYYVSSAKKGTPVMKYIVTIKLPRNKDHDPSNKKSGPCYVSHYCTDVTGEHHSFIMEAESDYDARVRAKEKLGTIHITRIEQVGL